MSLNDARDTALTGDKERAVEQTIYVPVTLHRDGDYPDVALLEVAWQIDDVLESARIEAKDLLRPYLNNQAYYQVDTPSIPQTVNRWDHNFDKEPGDD